jgi:hypothetical protein
MHDHLDDEPIRRDESRWVRMAERVADLGHPFYAEERQRDVWNEASAVGIQVTLWLGCAAAAVLAWLPDGVGAPFSLVVLGVVAAGVLATVGYAEALGVATDAPRDVAAGRALLMALLLLATAGGLVRWWVWPIEGGGFWGGFRIGVTAALGLVAIVVVVAAIVHLVRRPGRHQLARS